MTMTNPANTYSPEVPSEWAETTFNVLLQVSIKRELTVPELAQFKRARAVMLAHCPAYGELKVAAVAPRPAVPVWLAITVSLLGFLWLLLTGASLHGDWHTWGGTLLAVYALVWGIRKLPSEYKHAGGLGPWL